MRSILNFLLPASTFVIAIMGIQQSKPASASAAAARAHDKAMADRLRRMKLADDSVSAFSGDMVDNEKGAFLASIARDPHPLPLDTVSVIPSEFLEDPRNRSVGPSIRPIPLPVRAPRVLLSSLPRYA